MSTAYVASATTIKGNNPLVFLTAKELLSLYRSKQLSPVEVVKATLDQIDKYNKSINAYCFVEDEQKLLEAAKQSEARWAKGQPNGALDGIPISIKDMINTHDMPTLWGSKTCLPENKKDKSKPDDAPAVAHLKKSNPIIMGKTTTCEFGWKGVTDSPLTGITRNPHDLRTTSGGSSGGAAAAVSAGMCALALGTDGGGSVRIPGGFCGIVAHKPTFGLIPLFPPSPFGTLSHIGPMTRTVEDAALVLNVVGRADPRDTYSVDIPLVDYTLGTVGIDEEKVVETLLKEFKNKRLAYSQTLALAKRTDNIEIDANIVQLVDNAVKRLKDLGLNIDRDEPDVSDLDLRETFRIHWYHGAANCVKVRVPEHLRGEIDPGLLEIANQGTNISPAQLEEAQRDRDEWRRRMAEFHSKYEILITPTLPITAFEVPYEYPPNAPTAKNPKPESINAEVPNLEKRWFNWAIFSYPFNMTGQPATTVPVGYVPQSFFGSGRPPLPAGIQFVASRNNDHTALKMAHLYQKAVGPAPKYMQPNLSQ